jgi:hypothetical protein
LIEVVVLKIKELLSVTVIAAPENADIPETSKSYRSLSSLITMSPANMVPVKPAISTIAPRDRAVDLGGLLNFTIFEIGRPVVFDIGQCTMRFHL